MPGDYVDRDSALVYIYSRTNEAEVALQAKVPRFTDEMHPN
jgi:hypothetical protein